MAFPCFPEIPGGARWPSGTAGALENGQPSLGAMLRAVFPLAKGDRMKTEKWRRGGVAALCGLWLAAAGVVAQEAAAPRPPVNVIFDSDMDGDCDDVAALALLHVLADQGEARILATITSGRNEWSPQCMDAINTYFGRGDIPVGAPKQGGILRPSAYTKAVADRCPHRLPSAAAAEDAVELYRRLLMAQPDASVVVATVGFHTNLAALLRLPAADGKPSGAELIRKKVALWACMGGNFIGHPAKDDLALGNVNFQKDAPAAYAAIWNWPGRLVFVGREVASVPSGLKVGARFRDLPADHPVRIAYEAYFKGAAQDRHIADPATVLFAVRGLRDYWDIEDKGYMDLKEDMTFVWKYDTDKNQAYLLKRRVNGRPNDREVEAAVEKLVMTPPRARPAAAP